MKINRIAGIAALLTAGFAQAQAPAVKFDGALIEFWYTQMDNNNLRNNSLPSVAAAPGLGKYYDGMSSARFTENTFAIKRSEIYMSGKVTDDVSWNVMFDPNNNNTSTVPNNVLQDAVITWTPAKGFTIKAGQFKMPTTYEATIVSAREILFFDRNQLNRQFGDKRDRGVWLSYGYGDPQAFQGKVNLAVSNGTTEDGSGGKNNDGNAQKDWTFRFDGAYGPQHKFGAYYREGVSALKTSTFSPAALNPAWTVNFPTAQQVKDNADKTTLQGVYYAFDNSDWHFDAEYATGLLGRRFSSLNTWNREHLDQKYLGYAVTGVYKMGAHWLLARYDFLNYNSGDKWYTAYNPYKESAPGVATGTDYTPKYSEITVGYNYLFVPTKQTLGKLKLDYILRSKNFMAPRVGQTSEQGGNSLVASLMVAF